MPKFAVLLLLTLMLSGCAKQPVQAPVPGTINTEDAYAARVIGDAGAAIHAVKLWEVCSDSMFPAQVTFDNGTYLCDATAGPFPKSFRKPLFDAEQSYNIALAAGKAYHAGASNNSAALTTAMSQLTSAVAALFSATGAK